jgi:hypothetical protein
VALLWLNTIVAAAASAVWFLWAIKWFRRRHPLLAALYMAAAGSTLCFALGFTLVLYQGDPGVSAIVARQWVWGSVGIPAVARLIELLREEHRHVYADRLLASVEQRADRHDAAFGKPDDSA